LRELKIQLIKAKGKKITLTSAEIKVVDDNIKTNIIDAMGSGNRIKADQAFQSQYHVSIDEIRNMQLEISIVRKFQSGEMANAKITADQVKTYYDKNPDWYKEDTQMRIGAEEAVWARHILINAAADATQEVKDAAKKKADDLLAQLKAGADFATLAKANSEDTGSAQYGGDYVFGKGKMVPEFETAAFSMKPGQLYDSVVKTDYGYHIIMLIEKYAKDQPVSLKCATDYREFSGVGYIEYQLYKKQLEGWKKDKMFDVVPNTSVYDSTNG
jgi:parvulin-like peptidyl-prolyl isomerase